MSLCLVLVLICAAHQLVRAGHGDTHVSCEEDLSMDRLVKDLSECVQNLFKDDPVTPSLILMGHSMGGALATRLASAPCIISGLIQALIVLDVVEGSALESLSHMNNVLQTRPRGFQTIKDAIFWSATKSQTDDFAPIRVSVPGQLKQIDTNEPATHYVQEEQEYWKKFVSSRSTIDNLSLGAENTPNRSAADTPSLGGHERSAFQPVVAPASTSQRPPFTVESQVNYSQHRGLPAVVPTYNSASLHFRSARFISEAEAESGTSRTEDNAGPRVSPARPQPVPVDSEFLERLKEDSNSMDDSNSMFDDDNARALPNAGRVMNPAPTQSAASQQLFRPISPARFGGTEPISARGLANIQTNSSTERNGSGELPTGRSRMHPPGPRRSLDSSLPPIPQGNTLMFPWKRGEYAQPSNSPNKYTWRVNLFSSETFWEEWFTGMSDSFLECPAKKLLILCGTDRLDTKLLRGQMQGKFQTIYIKCGHQIQEDRPDELSDEVSQFLIRQKLCEPMYSPTASPVFMPPFRLSN
ncbi:uncharacterized protein LOC103510336 [Diaphorina citri]|uniref:protein phosphatase methylesterase-1 n=1 Tax=Diaphorina citri TaxID=121845 RepID=A0A1S3D314_DIACI|nr:uncharacterized protein LOC103510336 [Diaphorina citri]